MKKININIKPFWEVEAFAFGIGWDFQFIKYKQITLGFGLFCVFVGIYKK